MATLKTLSLILCDLVLQGSAAGAELAIHFTAIQKILAQLEFTQDGRKYLRGAPTVKCNYAYLENPLVGGDGGKLRVSARFSGRSALDVFGKCIGLGDSFEASITALPYYQDGVLRLKDVQVVGKGRDGFYIRRVCAALAESLRTQFKYRLLDDAKLILERKQDGTAYSQEVVRFHVPSVRDPSDKFEADPGLPSAVWKVGISVPWTDQAGNSGTATGSVQVTVKDDPVPEPSSLLLLGSGLIGLGGVLRRRLCG